MLPRGKKGLCRERGKWSGLARERPGGRDGIGGRYSRSCGCCLLAAGDPRTEKLVGREGNPRGTAPASTNCQLSEVSYAKTVLRKANVNVLLQGQHKR